MSATLLQQLVSLTVCGYPNAVRSEVESVGSGVVSIVAAQYVQNKGGDKSLHTNAHLQCYC